MTRRELFLTGTAALATASLKTSLPAETPSQPGYKLGVATTSYLTVWRPKDTLEFLDHCHSLGAAGIQAAIHGDIPTIRSRAEQYGMFVEAMVPMPRGNDTTAFEQSLADAKAVGAVALRSACLGTRRYETFAAFADWQQHVADSLKSIAAALPVLEKYKLPLGLENHKDWTTDEFAALLQKHSSEYLGVCLDFGNNISLLDDPMETIQKLAPYTVSTHLKNMGVRPAAEGFLLSEVLLGDGYLDLPKAISLVREARPTTRFSLEMITRDPLIVPCLGDKYWASFPDRNGLYLARTLRFVQQNASVKPLPRISQLTHDEQLRAEEQNVVECLRYAHEHLEL